MIKKMRIKLVALSMGLLFVLLTTMLIIVNLLTYYLLVDYCDSVLAILMENNGAFPEMFEDRQQGLVFSRELPYEARYFSVHLDESGAPIRSNTDKIAAIDSETANAYASLVWAKQERKGFFGDYRYALRAEAHGSFIVFLDCGRKLDDIQSFMFVSIGIMLAGYLIVFALLSYFSKWIVRPFADNQEKQKLFITNAGHELKTPLTIIDADVDVLEMEIGDNEWLQDIQKQTKRMAVLTNALVCLSRMEEADSRLPMIDFPLSDVVEETARSFQALSLSRNQKLSISVEPMISLCGDEQALRQLTSILLDNALKYAGEEGRISLTLNRLGRSVQLTVQNTSAPLSEEDIRRLFDRFYRTDKSHNTESGGHGIGLSIAKAIVTAHKGAIQAVSPEEGMLRITAVFSL